MLPGNCSFPINHLANTVEKSYKHIFFDLDHTLWDFDRNTTEAIQQIYRQFDFASFGFSLNEFLKHFHDTNNFLWNKYNHGEIDRLQLRNDRFKIILGKMQIDESRVPPGIGDAYLKIAPDKAKVVPFTHEILSYLHPKYHLHIISNGFDDVQHRKMKAAKIHHLFQHIITSDNSGFRKPQKGIFEFAMKQAGASGADSLFIGDNPETDVKGAINAEMDHVFYNPKKLEHALPAMHEIHSLKQLRNIL
jgi:putative hydrolase of the HAD superfamily